MSAQNWLNETTKAIQEKLKTTEKILPSSWPQIIRENWGSGGGGGGGALISILHKGGKVGTPVPMSGMVEKIYFNTDLTPEEVVQIVEEANLTFVEGMMYLIFLSVDNGTTLILMYMSGQCQIVDGFSSDALVYFTNDPSAEFQGWNPDIDFTNGIDFNSETTDLTVYGTTHDKLTKLISSTPFEVVEDSTEEIVLAGGYDGTQVKIDDLSSGWKGIIIPRTGLVENIYVNTELGTEEVTNLLSQLTYDYIGSVAIHSIFTYNDSMDFGDGLESANAFGLGAAKFSETNYQLLYVKIVDSKIQAVTIFASETGQGILGEEITTVGWQEFTSPIEFNKEAVEKHDMLTSLSGVENDKLTTLLSITPFVQTEKNVIDVVNYIDQKKIPNKFIVDVDKAPSLIQGTITEYKGDELMLRMAAFAFCNVLSKVEMGAIIIGDTAFGSCPKLTTAIFPNCQIIGPFAFASCTNLSSISFPMCTTVGSSAFYRCTSLNTINFPVCKNISAYAFYSCKSLTTASFPMCEYIIDSAFGYCSSLNTLYLTNSTSVAGLYNLTVFSGTKITSTTGSIYVHADQYENYKNATNWTYFANRFVSVSS